MAVAVVQSVKSADSNDGTSATVATQSWGVAPTSGNAIVVWVTAQVGAGTGHFASVKNGTGAGGATGSDTFSFIEEIQVSAADGISMAAFVCKNLTQTNPITANFDNTPGFRRITALEVSGQDTATQPNAHKINASAAFGTGTDAVTSTAATTTVDGCLVLGFGYDESASTIPAAGTGFTSVDTATWSAGDAWRVEKLTQGAQGSVAATFTDTVGGHSIGVSMVAIAPPVSATPTLSAAGAVSITTTTAVPQVTLTF